MDTSSTDLNGTILDEKYLIVRELGSGGMGVVYEGRNLAIERRVAIKMLLGCYTSNAEAVERFEREARASSPIEHPSIVDILDMGRTDTGRPYIVMEHLEGEVLFERLKKTGPMPPTEAVGFVLKVLDALAASHAAGVIHRDVKPENVFLVPRGDGEAIKLLDFGVAMYNSPRNTAMGRITRAGNVLGTPGYMSPEQAIGADVDARTDLYSTGVMLYELLSGKLPDGDDGLSGYTPILEVAPGVPAALARIVGKALTRSPALRYQTAAELIEDLHSWESQQDKDDYEPVILLDRLASPIEITRLVTTVHVQPSHLPGWLSFALTIGALIASTFAVRQVTEAAITERAHVQAVQDAADARPRKTIVSHATVSAIPTPAEVAAAPAVAAPEAAQAAAPAQVGRPRPSLPFTNVY